MKFLRQSADFLSRQIYLMGKGPGDGWLPEGPKDFRSIAIENIRETQIAYFQDPETSEALFLKAAEKFITKLPTFIEDRESIDLAFFYNAQPGLIKEATQKFLAQMDEQIENNPNLAEIKFKKPDQDPVLREAYYDALFHQWRSSQALLDVLAKVKHRDQK